MSPQKLTPAEFRTEDKDEAELVALMIDMIYYFDEEEEKYRLISRDEVQSKIKKLYDEDKYAEAEKLIDSIDRVSSKDTEEIIRESKSKSYRLSKLQFVKAVKKAYEKNVSVADILRSNISKKIESNLKNLYDISEIDQERLESLEEIVKRWAMKEGRSPLKDGYRLSYHIPTNPSEEKYEIFAKNLVKINFLEKKIDEEKLIDIYLKYYTIPDPEDAFYHADIRLNEDGGNVNLIFDHEMDFIIEHFDREKLNDFLSDIANLGFNKEELNDLPIFDKIYKLPEIVESIKDGDQEDIDNSPIYDRDEWDEIIKETSFPRLKIKIPLEINGGSLMFGGESLEIDSVKKIILDKILENFDGDLVAFDIDKAKQKAVECVKEGDYSSAKRINKQISLYDASKYMAGKIGDMMLDSLSSQVVSLTMPKGVYGLLKIFDLKKEDILW